MARFPRQSCSRRRPAPHPVGGRRRLEDAAIGIGRDELVPVGGRSAGSRDRGRLELVARRWRESRESSQERLPTPPAGKIVSIGASSTGRTFGSPFAKAWRIDTGCEPVARPLMVLPTSPGTTSFSGSSPSNPTYSGKRVSVAMSNEGRLSLADGQSPRPTVDTRPWRSRLARGLRSSTPPAPGTTS